MIVYCIDYYLRRCLYLILETTCRKKKKKDKSKVKDEKINLEENQDKLNHGIY